jgi:hypothetical protein
VGGRASKKIFALRYPVDTCLAGKNKIVPQQKGDVVAALKLKHSKGGQYYAYSNGTHPSAGFLVFKAIRKMVFRNEPIRQCPLGAVHPSGFGPAHSIYHLYGDLPYCQAFFAHSFPNSDSFGHLGRGRFFLHFLSISECSSDIRLHISGDQFYKIIKKVPLAKGRGTFLRNIPFLLT